MRILLIAALAFTMGAPTTANERDKAKVQEKSALVKDWKTDPACRLVFFAVLPALGDGAQAGAWSRATIYAALFGFFCYATYDLTNLATLKGWPVALVIADLAWGAFVSACAATASWFITRALAR